jgi:hypothetical protein
MVDIHDRCVPALIALNPQGPHAVLTHVLEVHRLDRVIETRVGHRTMTITATGGPDRLGGGPKGTNGLTP